MKRITITPRDLKVGKLLPPGPTLFEIKNITTKPAKTDQSTVYHIHLETEDQVPVTDYISEKTPGMWKALLEACGATVDEDAGITVDVDEIVGKKVIGVVAHQKYEGRIRNIIETYEPAS